MTDYLSSANHSLQQALEEVRNIVTAASSSIDSALRSGDEEKVKNAFANVGDKHMEVVLYSFH